MADKWKFKDNAEPQGTSDDFWYNLTLGGYINPARVLSNKEQLDKLVDAIETVTSFEIAMDQAGLMKRFEDG